MIKAFPWKSGGSSKTAPGQPREPGSPPVLPDETAGRVYGAELNRVEAKLNSLLAAVTAAAEAQPVNWAAAPSASRRPSLGAAISEISRRQQELDAWRAAPARDPLTAPADPQSYEARARATSLVALQNDIAGLASKLDAMQREQNARYATPPICNLDKLRGEIAAMSEALRDVASRGSVATVEAAIRGLSQKIEDSRNGGTRDAILRPMEELVAELRQSLAEIDPRMTIKGLESEVSKLGSKIDDLGRTGVDPATFGHIQAQTREIRDLLSAAIARPLPVERIERQVAELAQSLGEQRATAPRENFVSVRGAEPAQFSAIEARLEQIAAKVEESLNAARDQSRYQDLSDRIDSVHEGLSARIADVQRAAPNTSALEDLVRSLSDKIERAVAPQADHRAIEALEEQISLLAQRLEASNPALSLSGLERAVGELFGEFERTRTASLEAAELSARNAVREALGGASDHAAEREKLAGELVELRDRQDQADQRTLSTLNAVHETLEKVVERLSTFESELTERRGAPNDLPPPPPYNPPSVSPPPFVERQDTRPPEPPSGGATEDFLIEPGSGYRGRRDNGNSNGAPPVQMDALDAPASRSDFIAAARRAAQAAQRETAAASVLSQVRPGPAPIGAGKAGLLQSTRTIFAQYRRPVVLSLAAIFVAIGAYAVLKSLGHPPTKVSSLEPPAIVANVSPPVPSAPPQTSATMNAPAKVDDSALSPNSIVTPPPAPPPSMANIDPMATGSIGHAPRLQQSRPREISLADLYSEARGGSALAQFALAVSYTDGRTQPRDLKTAAQWYEKAAAQGFAPAQYRLASFYEKGLGVARDATKAQAFYQKAALQGNVRAMHNLAVLAADGGDSGRPDYAMAAHWFKQAADYGVRDSQYNYAVLLARGMGVPQDFVASYVWFDLAAKQGDQDSANKRDDVGARLSAAQLATAKATADAFRPRVPPAAANDVVLPRISVSPRPSSEAPLSFGQRPKVSML